MTLVSGLKQTTISVNFTNGVAVFKNVQINIPPGNQQNGGTVTIAPAEDQGYANSDNPNNSTTFSYIK